MKIKKILVLIILIILLPLIIIELNVRYEINKIDDEIYDIGQKLYNKINIKRPGCSDYYYLIGKDIKYDDLSEADKLYIAISNINDNEIIINKFEHTIPLEKIDESYKLIFGIDKKISNISNIDTYSMCKKNEKTIICQQEILPECDQAKYSYHPSYIGSYIKSNNLYLLIKITKEDNFRSMTEKDTSNIGNIYKVTFKLDDNNNWYWEKTKIISNKLFEY